MKNKKGKAWVWILVILALVIAGVGAWMIFGGGGEVIADAVASSGVPSPPALPS